MTPREARSIARLGRHHAARLPKGKLVEALVALADPPEVAGAAEAAGILGVLGPNLYKVDGLPESFQAIGAGKLWLADDLRELAERRAAAPTAA